MTQMHIDHPPAEALRTPARALVEEIACAIADAQAALLTGRVRDLEACILRQQELCAALQNLILKADGSLLGPSAATALAAARHIRDQNQVFGHVLWRMRRHLETLRNLLAGPPLTYQPKTLATPGPES